MDDSDIIAAVRAGDRNAFGTLVERYQRTLYYFVVGKVGDDTQAKDIVQKTFVAAFQNLDGFRVGESFFAWLKGIALNHCRNEWRRYQSEARRAEISEANPSCFGLKEPFAVVCVWREDESAIENASLRGLSAADDLRSFEVFNR